MAMVASCQPASKLSTVDAQLSTPGNPYMPLWEHIPDGEPYVFEDPDQPGTANLSTQWVLPMYCMHRMSHW